MLQPYILKEIVTIFVSQDYSSSANYQIIQLSLFLVFTRFIKYLIDEYDYFHNLRTGVAASKAVQSMVFKK